MRSRIITFGVFIGAFCGLTVNHAVSACLNPPASLQTIAQFKANPKALVTPNADMRTIEATARDIAGTDATLAADLVRVAESTTPRFQTAIAAGLAQAALACASVDQKAAQLIQQAVANYQDGQFQASFAAVAGDLSTAAIEAAAASASSSVGSVVVNNPNPSSSGLGNVVQGTTSTFKGSGTFTGSGPSITSNPATGSSETTTTTGSFRSSGAFAASAPSVTSLAAGSANAVSATR